MREAAALCTGYLSYSSQALNLFSTGESKLREHPGGGEQDRLESDQTSLGGAQSPYCFHQESLTNVLAFVRAKL